MFLLQSILELPIIIVNVLNRRFCSKLLLLVSEHYRLIIFAHLILPHLPKTNRQFVYIVMFHYNSLIPVHLGHSQQISLFLNSAPAFAIK